MVAPFLPTLAAGRLALSFTGQDPAAGSPPVVPPPPPAAESTAPPVSQPTTTAPPMPAPAVATDDEVAPLGPSRRTEGPEPAPTGPLRATDKRFFFSLFVGSSRSLRSGYAAYYGGGNDFKIEGAIGGHGKRRPHIAGAAVLQVKTGFPLTSFTLMPRLQIDRPISKEYAIYFTSVFQVGYRFAIIPGGGGNEYGYSSGPAVYHSGVAGVGFGASMIVAERLLLSFRPANFEIVVPGYPYFVDVRWDAIGGIGVVW